MTELSGSELHVEGPLFSIVVPAYNAEATLAETLDGIEGQEYVDWECVVVDDGSQDDTPLIAADYARRDPRFRAVSQTNQGSAGTYNAGVADTTGDFIVVCSADDILLPKHLATVGAFIERNPEYGIFSSNGWYLRESGDKVEVYQGADWEYERSLTLADLLSRCFFSVGAVYRRSVFELAGGYRPGVYGEDYDFWLRAMAKGVDHRYTPHLLSVHRISTTQKSSNLLRLYESNIEIYENLINDGWVQLEDVSLVRMAITAKRHLVFELVRSQLRRERLAKIRRGVSRLLGQRAADRVVESSLVGLRTIRKVGTRLWHWVARR